MKSVGPQNSFLHIRCICAGSPHIQLIYASVSSAICGPDLTTYWFSSILFIFIIAKVLLHFVEQFLPENIPFPSGYSFV